MDGRGSVVGMICGKDVFMVRVVMMEQVSLDEWNETSVKESD